MTSRAAESNGDAVLTPADVAKWLQVEERQVQRFTNAAKHPLPALRLGHKTVRFLRADVLAWLAQQRSPRQTNASTSSRAKPANRPTEADLPAVANT